MKARFQVTLFLLLLLGEPAAADWQYTKWGMTQDEVLAASNGTAAITSAAERKANRTEEADALLVAPYISGQFKFQAFFMFDLQAHKLTQVRMKLEIAARCNVLRQTLTQKYGNPIADGVAGIFSTDSWRDETGRNKLVLVKARDCTLIYAPLQTDDASGL